MTHYLLGTSKKYQGLPSHSQFFKLDPQLGHVMSYLKSKDIPLRGCLVVLWEAYWNQNGINF